MVEGLLFKKQDQITMFVVEEGMTGGIMVVEEMMKEEVADIEEVVIEDMAVVMSMGVVTAMEVGAVEGTATGTETDIEVQRMNNFLPFMLCRVP